MWLWLVIYGLPRVSQVWYQSLYLVNHNKSVYNHQHYLALIQLKVQSRSYSSIMSLDMTYFKSILLLGYFNLKIKFHKGLQVWAESFQLLINYTKFSFTSMDSNISLKTFIIWVITKYLQHCGIMIRFLLYFLKSVVWLNDCLALNRHGEPNIDAVLYALWF